ncbi:hypothetical protein [Streptomyces sp. NPDC003032]
MDARHQPTLDDIEDRFALLLEGRLTRDEVDRWATRWVADDRLAGNGIASWALNLLCGIDLPVHKGGGYLHDDEQLQEWLAELRKRRRMI